MGERKVGVWIVYGAQHIENQDRREVSGLCPDSVEMLHSLFHPLNRHLQ